MSTSSEGAKRKIPDSVVTIPTAHNAKRGKKIHRIASAAWLTGAPPVSANSG